MTVVLAFVAVNHILSVRRMVWQDPVGLAVDITAFGMVLVIVARAIDARRSRNDADW